MHDLCRRAPVGFDTGPAGEIVPVGLTATDSVCGMEVNPEIATAQGLSSEHDGETHHFCGKGCKLDFDEDPQKVLAPGYTPGM